MSNGSVHVTVDTRAVAAEVSRLRGDINQVAGEVRGVSNNIHVMQAELVAQMGVTIERLNAVKNEVSRSIEAAAQAKIVEAASEIFGKAGIITSSAKRISQQYHKSIIRCGRMSDKFDRLNDEVKASYHTDIRRLGKYIFDIWYNHYQKVEDCTQKQHTGFLTTIKRSVEQIRKQREQKLEELLKAVKEKLELFLEQRKSFHDSISRITAGKLAAPVDKIAIPMIIVKKRASAVSQIKIGHEVISEENEHIGYCLKETDLFKTYRSDHSNLDKYVHWREMTPGELKQLEHNLGRLLEKKHIGKEYHDLLIQVLKKHPPKVPEQFEMPQTGEKLSSVIHSTSEEAGKQAGEIKFKAELQEEEDLMSDEIRNELENEDEEYEEDIESQEERES